MDKKEAIFNAASAFEIKYGNVATYYAFVGRAHGMSLPSHPGTLQHAVGCLLCEDKEQVYK